MFRDKNGKCHDYRPHDPTNLPEYVEARLRGENPSTEPIFKPTILNFRKLESPVLRKLLLLAYREQLKTLKSDSYEPYDTLYENSLKKNIAARIEQLSGA